MQKFYDLIFSRQPDGSIRLIQSDFGEDCIIDLHPAQLRHVAEAFALVAPNYPADELSKRLAEQLCTIMKALEAERHHSHCLELIYTKLDAWCSALPEDIYPYALWDNEPDEPAQATQILSQSPAQNIGETLLKTARATHCEQLDFNV